VNSANIEGSETNHCKLRFSLWSVTCCDITKIILFQYKMLYVINKPDFYVVLMLISYGHVKKAFSLFRNIFPFLL
jgi:hypothetical protein